MSVTVWELKNGIRVVHRPMSGTRLVHCGMVLDVGSRDERMSERGMAHFIEHMVFKGTARRKAYHILSRIDSVGGELNAYTTKEKTVYHATVTRDYAERAFDLLADITFFSTFPDRELEKEKTVIADEIDMYRDDPEEAIFEDFDQHVFRRHPLGQPIAGTKASIQRFDRSAVRDFFARNYGSDRIVFSVVGDCTLAQAQLLAERHFDHLPSVQNPVRRSLPAAQPVRERIVKRPLTQTHFILGGRAYALTDARHTAFQVLNNHLGGPSMNSRLNLNIRERYGLGYNIQSFYQPFIDTGIWGVYASVEPDAYERALHLVHRELAHLRANRLSEPAMTRIKRQFIGSLIISHESHFNAMISQGKELLDLGHIYELEEGIAQVERLTARDLQRVADELFAPSALDLLVYAPSRKPKGAASEE
jgi:predicted Zn-dependent peptidase